LCVSRCGATAVIEDGRFSALEPDPSHPTGKALCAKGRAAPELVYHAERLRYPLRRTRPKGDPDPGWERISWDEALDLTARKLGALAASDGPESVVFSLASPSTSASVDSLIWIERLMRAFGSPNECVSMELCGWGRYGAPIYTFGASVPGAYMPDLERAGCILFWGYNPNLARLAHAVATSAALERGARLIVVDPRRVGPANKADVWLRVRPGTDGALALGLANAMIERGWYDREFVRRWTNAPLLVRTDTGRLLTEADLSSAGNRRRLMAWDAGQQRAVAYDPATRAYEGDHTTLALSGALDIPAASGPVSCRPVFDLVTELCARFTPSRVHEICGIEPATAERAARLLWESRPVAYYAWSGVEMQSNSTQIARAIAQLYALTGCVDSPGGNVLFASVPTADVSGMEFVSAAQHGRTLGAAARPLGPSRFQHVTTDEVYRAILDGQPYRVRGLVGFGANLLVAHADGLRGRDALAALDFYVHCDLFLNPTAELADVVLPVASAFEREALKVGFEISQDAQSLVQLRRRVAQPPGEARGDTDIVFDLATRMGLGEHFWNGDVDAAYRHQLAPSGVTLDALRKQPTGVRLPLDTRYHKYTAVENGHAHGFATPSGLVELYSETMLDGGYPPLPDYEAPMVSHAARPDLASRFPLILTCAKHTLFCESQHRALPSLRRHARHPEVELHPAAAADRGISAGDWVSIETPHGRVRARARLNDSLEPGVVCGQHGWWQACAELGAPGYDAFSPDGASFNLIIGNDAMDPVSGSVPHRAYVCEVRRVGPESSLPELFSAGRRPT
jgi:anaerobic selenocysteine-containing dehydrogenase